MCVICTHSARVTTDNNHRDNVTKIYSSCRYYSICHHGFKYHQHSLTITCKYYVIALLLGRLPRLTTGGWRVGMRSIYHYDKRQRHLHFQLSLPLSRIICLNMIKRKAHSRIVYCHCLGTTLTRMSLRSQYDRRWLL